MTASIVALTLLSISVIPGRGLLSACRRMPAPRNDGYER
jgi:hypothetical protein